ncbi:hypothetical protein LTR37_015687 [Vermiconidia calcicola]|uniref:Uncharacterized protein n=1 Tax=Vermiconidia calcicola TaxID=1690605 RepID=A0ACC3MQ03_9PEZI|nr:hypothetical protein LTR37_015687 [Vermiconidia calcicola]
MSAKPRYADRFDRMVQFYIRSGFSTGAALRDFEQRTASKLEAEEESLNSHIDECNDEVAGLEGRLEALTREKHEIEGEEDDIFGRLKELNDPRVRLGRKHGKLDKQHDVNELGRKVVYHEMEKFMRNEVTLGQRKRKEKELEFQPQGPAKKRKWADLKESTGFGVPVKKPKGNTYTDDMLVRDEDDEEELPVPLVEAEDGIKKELDE